MNIPSGRIFGGLILLLFAETVLVISLIMDYSGNGRMQWGQLAFSIIIFFLLVIRIRPFLRKKNSLNSK